MSEHPQGQTAGTADATCLLTPSVRENDAPMGLPRRGSSCNDVFIWIGNAVGILETRRTHEEAELVHDADNRPVYDRLWLHYRRNYGTHQGAFRRHIPADQRHDRGLIRVHGSIDGFYLEHNARCGRRDRSITSEETVADLHGVFL